MSAHFAIAIDPVPGTPSPVDDVASYRLMLSIRRFEEKLGQLVALGLVEETLPLATGREGIAAGIAAAARKGEPIVNVCGAYAAEFCRGTGPEALFMRAISNSGAALREPCSEQALVKAIGLVGGSACVFCWIAVDEGGKRSAISSLMSAAEQRWPVVCVAECLAENEVHYECAATEGIRSDVAVEIVDARDVDRVVAVIRQAALATRSGEGPALIAVRTSGYVGHAAAAAQREAGIKAGSREDTDPIARARAALIDGGISEAELKKLEKSVRDEINAAALSARTKLDSLQTAV